MIEIAGCEKRKFKAICSSIDKLDKEPWSKVCQELQQQKGCTVEQTDKLHEFVQFKGQPWEMLADLKDQQWDVILLNETWRKQLEESWTTEQQHTFVGSGHDSGRRGVGILIHRRWTK